MNARDRVLARRLLLGDGEGEGVCVKSRREWRPECMDESVRELNGSSPPNVGAAKLNVNHY